jgi:hypothetical protein
MSTPGRHSTFITFAENDRHFDTLHSSAHKGTNHGLKSHSAGVKGTMDVDTSAETLNTQTSIRVADTTEMITFTYI